MSDNFFFTQELEYPTSSSSSCESSESEDSLPDISRLKPYDFEPEIPYAEEEQTPESEQSILTSRIGNTHWCLCGECKPMETEVSVVWTRTKFLMNILKVNIFFTILYVF